jgi:hypothetical protein
MSAKPNHANQCRRPFPRLDIEGLLVDWTPGGGSGGGEWLVSLMPRRVRHKRRRAWCKLGSGSRSGVAALYSVKLVDEFLNNRLRILHIPAR